MTGEWDTAHVLRAIVSRGWADEDADVVSDLLTQAHNMAALIIADDTVNAELRATAQGFLDQLRSDTFGQV